MMQMTTPEDLEQLRAAADALEAGDPDLAAEILEGLLAAAEEEG